MSDIKGLVNIHTGREVQYLAPPGYIYNLQISNNILNPNTQIDIAAGYAKSDDYEGDILLPASTTLDLTTDIDTGGAPALSKWYYPWLASDRDGNIVGKISESYTTPVLPAGYVYKRRVGSFYNNAAGNIRTFEVIGNSNKRITRWVVLTLQTAIPALTPGSTSYNFSDSIPPTSEEIYVRALMFVAGGVARGYMQSIPSDPQVFVFQTASNATAHQDATFLNAGIQSVIVSRYTGLTSFSIHIQNYTEYL